MPDNHVRPNSHALTDSDARHLLASGLLRACHEHGPGKVAIGARCDEKTIRRARDEETTLGLASAFNLLDVDPHSLDALLAAKGFLVLPMTIGGATDIIASAGAAVHRIGRNRDPQSPGGQGETDRELIESEAENDALLLACIERRATIGLAKLRLSGLAA